MEIQISDSKFTYEGKVVKRKAVELSFTCSKQHKFVSLQVAVKHFVDDKELRELDYTKELVATNNNLVYSDNGEPVKYEIVKRVVKESLLPNEMLFDEYEVEDKIPVEKEGVDIIGEYDYFLSLRDTKVVIDKIIKQIIVRADKAGRL